MDEKYKEEILVLKKELEDCEKQKEEILITSRSLLQNAKKAIFALQRGHVDDAALSIEKNGKELAALYEKYGKSKWAYLLKDCSEEHAESILFYSFIKDEKLASPKDVGVCLEAYIGGLSDCAGEIVRYCYRQYSLKNYEIIKNAQGMLDDVFALLLEFNFRGELRKKFDAIKYHMQNLQKLVFEVDTLFAKK